jgi:uncharacterized protein (TIGR03067 family)
MKALLTLFLLAGLLASAPAPRKDAARDEATKLVGTWVLISCEGDTGKVPDEILKKEVVRFIIRSDTITMTTNGENKELDQYELEPKAKPKTIDLIDKEGRRALGIYSLEGDTLRICWREGGKPRPTAFAAKPGYGADLLVLVREKPRKPDREGIQGAWKVVEATWAGEKVPNLDKLTLVFVFRGNRWETRSLDVVESRGTFTLRREKPPKEIDLLIAGEEGTQQGIYQFEENRLNLCLPDRGRKERPQEFASTKDNKCSVFILERKK